MIDLRVKSLFFDAPQVVRAVDRARRAALSRAGAFVRRRARSSMRRARSPSRPGQPPRVQTGLLRQHIYFAYDPETDSVVVGPARVKNSDAPAVLEYGGRATIVRRRRGRRVKIRRTIAARPYMRPALDAERAVIADVWRDSVRAT